MVQPTFPGVYIREVSSGVRTITGVATSITAFVGEAASGVMFEPTRVLGFTEYERIFSSDTSLGEMTDQVRQFFLNGGSQAIIVRVASNAIAADVSVDNSGGATAVLTLTAKSAGTAGNALRASVDYKTSSPERTFNLRLYRETFDASGIAQAVDEEVFKDLSMDSTSARFVTKILDQESGHAKGVVSGVVASAGFSASGQLFANDAGSKAAIKAAIQATVSGTVGQLRVKYGSDPFRDVTVQLADVDPLGGADSTGRVALQNAINGVLQGPTIVIEQITNGPMIIRPSGATPAAVDILIERAAQNDIASKLHLGAAQGGLEVGSFSDDRPAPTGYVSQVGNVTDFTSGSANLLGTLLEFAFAAKTTLARVTMSGPRGFGFITVGFGDTNGNMAQGSTGADRFLVNVIQRLQSIADAINADATASQNWRAEVHGFRLVLNPRFGDATAGPGHTISSDNGVAGTGYNLSDATAGTATNLFGGPLAPGSVANVAAYSLGTGGPGDRQGSADLGNNGNVPLLSDYRTAFTQIDQKVDLFNLMVLPRSARDDQFPSKRSQAWGEASSFCQRRRAFLLVDFGPDATSVTLTLNARTALRAGVVGDHAAVYWPPIRIPVNGSTKNIDPSGSVAGVMSRIDSVRGVWKAPAGLEADVRGSLAVSIPMSDPENGLLNPEAINAIRSFPNGIIVWGSRTLSGFDNSGNDDYKYVPVRRFALFIEESLYRGVKFAVFEPNAEPLWSALRTAVGAFMNNLFRQGAFAGKTTREAYFVKVDSETTTQNDINLGIVNVVVGFAPLKPAEFVVITIKQQAGQVQV